MYLLDTNVISELRRADKAAPSVRRWFEGCKPEELYCSTVSILELKIGALRALRKDPAKGRVLQEWLEGKVLPNFGERIFPVNTSVALRCAPLHVPDPKPDRDAFIAGTALVHGFTVVTRNVKDFEPMGVVLINPWESAET